MKSNKIYVRLDSQFQDRIKTKSGIVLFDDTTWHPEWGVTTFGEVVTAPEKSHGRPGYEGWLPVIRGDRHFGGMPCHEEDIAPDVKPGDRIYFRYTCVFEKKPVLLGGEYLWLVPLSDVFCVIRDSEIIPIGSNVLMEPIEEENITSEVLIIPETLNRKVSTDKAIVRHIGKPLRGFNKANVKPGDVVVYNSIVGEKYKIEEVDYVICLQDDLLVKLG